MRKSQELKTNCEHHGCKDRPLGGAACCWSHLADKDRYVAALTESVSRGEDLSGYNLHKADLKGAQLGKAILSEANLSQADLAGAQLFDANLEDADLIGASLFGADLTHCDLKGADLTKAKVNEARLWNANLVSANLTECDMSGSDMWDARLYNARLWHTSFRDAKSISKRSFSKSEKLYGSARVNESGLLSAEEAYRDLKGYFLSHGMYNDASWAAFKEKTMERLMLRKKKNLNYIPSQLMNMLCGYGEKPYRIIISAFGAILLFAILYGLLNSIECPASPGYAVRWYDYIYYSTITFTTVGYGDFVPKANGLFRLLAASEAFSGIYLAGLFIFTLARKYSAR